MFAIKGGAGREGAGNTKEKDRERWPGGKGSSLGGPGTPVKMPSRHFSGVMCSNQHCRRTSPGDGPTCRWHVRNYGTEDEPLNVTLCNACKINYDQGKYCPYCVQIYREKDPDSFDGKEWIGCTSKGCRRWVHAECEAAGGDDHLADDGSRYQCPPCRETAEASERRKFGRHNAADRHGGSDKAASPASDGEDSSQLGSACGKPPALSRSQSWSGLRSPSLRAESRAASAGGPTPGSPMPRLRVDLSKLQPSSLRRYKRVYKLRDTPNKEGLKLAVAQHFATLVVNEEDIFRDFVQTCLRRHRASLSQSAEQAAAIRGMRRGPRNQGDTQEHTP